MLNFYQHYLIYQIILFTTPNCDSLPKILNSEYDANMNGLQNYYISQSSNVEEPEYFLDSFFVTTKKYENIKSYKFVDILRQNSFKNSENNVRKDYAKYPLTEWIKFVSGPGQDYSNRGAINLDIRRNSKRDVDLPKHSEDSSLKESAHDEIDQKIKEMDLADNPDVLIALFINILKKKYPRKLAEMKDLLDKMANSGDLICTESNDIKEVHPEQPQNLLENLTTLNLEHSIVNENKAMTSNSPNTIKTNISVGDSKTTSVPNTNKFENDNEENHEDEEEDDDDEEDDNDAETEDESVHTNNTNDYNYMLSGTLESKEMSKKGDRKEADKKVFKNKNFKSVIQNVTPLVMPTIESNSARSILNIFNKNSTKTTMGSEVGMTKEATEMTTGPESTNTKKLDKLKWKLQLQTVAMYKDESKSTTEPARVTHDLPPYGAYIPTLESTSKEAPLISSIILSEEEVTEGGTDASISVNDINGSISESHLVNQFKNTEACERRKVKKSKHRLRYEGNHRHKKKYKGI